MATFYVNAKLLRQFGKNAKEGNVLFKEGDPGECMYVVHRGKVKITKLVDGVPQMLTIMTDGQFFGEMAIINKDQRSATATCLTDCELLEIPAAGFELLMSKSPEIALQLIHGFSDRLKSTNKMLNVLFYQDDFSRVILTMHNMAELKAAEGNQIIRIPVDPNVLAGTLNMSVTRVQKVLDDVCKAEVVVREETGYRIPKPMQLLFFLRFIHERAKKKVA